MEQMPCVSSLLEAKYFGGIYDFVEVVLIRYFKFLFTRCFSLALSGLISEDNNDNRVHLYGSTVSHGMRHLPISFLNQSSQG